MRKCESDLPAQEDDPGVGVVEGQQDAAAGVQLLQAERLTEVLLPGQRERVSQAGLMVAGRPRPLVFQQQSWETVHVAMQTVDILTYDIMSH